jgi:hypothetical protein
MRFSPSVFAVAFCCAYIYVFAANEPLFLYYPLHGQFTWGHQLLKGSGPAMAWYGLMASAGIVSTVLALVIPERAIGRLRGYLWLFPCAAMLASVFLLRKLFL